MNSPDYEFWKNLAEMKTLHEQLGEILKYEEKASYQKGCPMDLNGILEQSQIDEFKGFATNLEDKVLEILTKAETVTTYPDMMREDLEDQECQLLSEEGDRVGALVGE